MSKRSTKLEAFNDIFEENDITRNDISFHDDLIREIKRMQRDRKIFGRWVPAFFCP